MNFPHVNFVLAYKMEYIALTPEIAVVNHFLSAAECQQFIRESETEGYSEALITTPRGQVMRKDIRNNTRLLRNDPELAAALFEKAKPFLPQQVGNYHLLGFNELFRFYRYHPGEQFKKHRDGSYLRNAREVSYYTFMIYLNAGFEGGSTLFDELEVLPEAGKALIFRHTQLHEGTTVNSGVKYVLRTDVMYRFEGE